MELVRFDERMRGTRGGEYIYVAEGNELVRISEYAINKTSSYRSGDITVHEVPIARIAWKVLYCFSFSRSGYMFIYRYRIDSQGRRVGGLEFLDPEKHTDELRNLRFRVEDQDLIYLIRQFDELFIPMIDEIKEYERILDFRIGFNQKRLRDAYENPLLYYFAFMSLPGNRSRINSLKVTRRWIYQLWVLKLLCEALRVSKFKRHSYLEEYLQVERESDFITAMASRYEIKPGWIVEQGSEYSTAMAETPFGDFTFWLEFQLMKDAHLVGMFMDERAAIRPDIVAVRGSFRRTIDFVNSKKGIDLIVECKEGPFDSWKNDIESQILKYLALYEPNRFILASLEQVPYSVKRSLERMGIKVIDELKPNSKSIQTFQEEVVKF